MGQTLEQIKGRREDSWYGKQMAPEMRTERVSLDELKLLMRLRSVGGGDYVIFVRRAEHGSESPMDSSDPAQIEFRVKEISRG